MIESRIEGVEFKYLETHGDDRGFFREVLRSDDPFFSGCQFGQWSHSLMFDGVIKAWHYHEIQTDWFYVPSGILRAGLCDMRKGSPTYNNTMDFLMGDHQKPMIVKIPPGIAHGVKTIQGPVHLLYFMTHVYNPKDEIRIPYNDPSISFDWLKGPAIK